MTLHEVVCSDQVVALSDRYFRLAHAGTSPRLVTSTFSSGTPTLINSAFIGRADTTAGHTENTAAAVKQMLALHSVLFRIPASAVSPIIYLVPDHPGIYLG